MQSVILISNSQIDLNEIEIQWKNKAIDTNNMGDRLAIDFENGRIYLDLMGDGLSEYDEGERDDVTITSYNFCSIAYSNSTVLESFIHGTIFSNKAFIDDDKGNIVKYSEFASGLRK